MIDKVLDILAKNIHEYLKHLPDLNMTSQETIHEIAKGIYALSQWVYLTYQFGNICLCLTYK